MKNLKRNIAVILLAVTGFALVPQPQPARADILGSIGGFIQQGFSSLPGLVSSVVSVFSGGAVSGANTSGVSLNPSLEGFGGPLGSGGVSAPLAVPTSVENPLQPGVHFNLKEFMLDIAKSFSSYVLRKYTQNYVGNFINSTLSKYKINSYLSYGMNLADQVYVLAHMDGDSSVRRYITQKVIQDINNNPFGQVNLNPLFTNLALQNYDFSKISTKTSIADVYSYIGLAGDMGNQPWSEKIHSIDYAAKVKSDASYAASLAISTGRGNKDSLNCQTQTQQVLKEGIKPTGNNPAGDFESIPIPVCAIVNPGQYASQHIDSRLNSLLGLELKPQDHLGEIAKSIGDLIGGAIFGKEIINNGKGQAANSPLGG